MRIPFLSLFVASPFEHLIDHAEKAKECAWAFQQAIECHISKQCQTFQEFKEEVEKIENEADAIKRRIRRNLPHGTLMPLDKFQFFRYLREQDHIVDVMQDVVDLISYRTDSVIPDELVGDFKNLVDSATAPVEQIVNIVTEAKKYFENYSESQREKVKQIIRTLRKLEQESDKIEEDFKKKVLNIQADPVTIFILFKIAEKLGEVANHAENAGDMMRAMIAK